MGKFRKGFEAKVSGPFCFFGKGIAHAKSANPTTLLTRFAGGASKGARGGRVGGISKFEIRNAEIGNWRV